MVDTRKLDLKLKRLRSIEGDYKSIIKRAEVEYKHNLLSREKYLKIKKKNELKIQKLLPKVRRLVRKRNALKLKRS